MSIARLSDLKIVGFRAFRELHVPRIASVNLIVGKNSTGKTTLLEAIWLYYGERFAYLLYELLSVREEYLLQASKSQRDDTYAFDSLFWGRRPRGDHRNFSISSPSNSGTGLRVSSAWFNRQFDETTGVTRIHLASIAQADVDPENIPGLLVETDSGSQMLPLDRLDRYSTTRRQREQIVAAHQAVFVRAVGLTQEEIGHAWDAIALTPDEDIVASMLRAIVPDLERMVLVQANERSGSRIMMAKLSGFLDPVPFRSLGEGALRMLSTALALVRARNGVLLIDEIENGLHYSVQTKMWQMIFEQSQRWNIQVFATTHSWDCVEGFNTAASQQQSSSALIRLEASLGSVRAVEFTAEELAIARQEHIEIR